MKRAVYFALLTIFFTLILVWIEGNPSKKDPAPEPQPPVNPTPPVPQPPKPGPKPAPKPEPPMPKPEPKPAPPAQEKEPGDDVAWYFFPKQKQKADNRWGPVLTDIEEHLPSSYGNQYYDNDPVTHGHETTHGINSEVRNKHAKGMGRNGFYCLNDRAVILTEPKVRIQQIAPLVPKSLQGSRYNLYLVQQARSWGDMPTYIFDEWVAYINGAEVGIDQHRSGKKPPQHQNDSMIGPIEFVHYALAVCLAVEKHDPIYMKSEHVKNFKEFVAHEIRRSARVHREGTQIDHYKWDTPLVENFTTSEDAQVLRDMAVRWYGEAFVRKYLYTP